MLVMMTSRRDFYFCALHLMCPNRLVGSLEDDLAGGLCNQFRQWDVFGPWCHQHSHAQWRVFLPLRTGIGTMLDDTFQATGASTNAVFGLLAFVR